MSEIARVAKTSAAAVWSLILGILSLLCFGLFAGIPAIVCDTQSGLPGSVPRRTICKIMDWLILHKLHSHLYRNQQKTQNVGPIFFLEVLK